MANELDHLEEDLHYERGEYPPALIREADETLRAVTHFQEVLRRQADEEHLLRDFREMDAQVHQLVNRLNERDDNWLKRQAARIQYADEQLHYLLRTGREGGANDFQEVLARHAHMLENGAKQLEELVDRVSPRDGREGSLRVAAHAFSEEAEHFHQVVEKAADRQHLLDDFRTVDDAWRVVVREVNASPYGLYFRRVAQRTNQVHNQVADLLGRSGRGHDDHADHDDHDDERRQRSAERPRIEFEIPNLGRFQLR
ncbi:MAG: hypothetical protein ACYC6N_04900 [Pirellulaceae bacterium]